MTTVFGEPPLSYTISDETLREELLDPHAARAWVVSHADDPMATPVWRMLGELDLALECGQARLATLDEGSPQWAAAALRLAHVHHWRGDYAEARQLFDLSQDVFTRSGDGNMLAFVHQHRAKAHFDQQRWEDALRESREALTLREAHGDSADPALLASARQTLATIEAATPLVGARAGGR